MFSAEFVCRVSVVDARRLSPGILEAQNYLFVGKLCIFCLKQAQLITKRNDFLVKSITFAPEIQTIVTAMTPNKQFNTYKEGLDLEFLREYCMEHGERRVMERGETLEEAGEPAQWVAFVERGCFKYMVHNDEEGRSATKETLATKGTQEGLLHGLRLRGRVRGRLPLLPRRRRVGGEHRG